MKITEAIALEHASLSRVFDEVKRVLPRAESAGEVGRMAAMLEELLKTHAELETEFAFVALDDAPHHNRRLAALRHDHRELDERFRQAQKAASCEAARRLLRGGIRAAREHFRNEERNLLPAVERALGLGVLTALGGAFKKKAMRAKSKGQEQTGLGI